MTIRGRLTVVAALATLLASLSISANFRTGVWFWPATLAIAVSAAGCALGRKLNLPRPVIPLLGLLGLLLLLTWLYADDAIFGLIPGPGAIGSMNQLLLDAGRAMARYQSPAPATDSLLFVSTAGVGFIAIVVDTLAVTYRSAALAGLPLLTLYAVPVTVVKSGVPWIIFVLGALGWLALLLTEGRERLSGWGRSLGRRNTRAAREASRGPTNESTHVSPINTGPAEPLGVVGRRIGAAALGLAVIVPALLPTLGTGLFGGNGSGSGPGKGSGAGSAITVNPFVQLSGELNSLTDAEVLRYQSNDRNPDYLLLVTLDSFDGKIWKPANMSATGLASDPFPNIPGLAGDVASTEITTKFNLTQLNQTWAPAPYPATKVSGLDDGWAYDGSTRNIFSVTGGGSKGNEYEVVSRHLQPTPEQLKFAGSGSTELRRRFTALPDRFPNSVTDKAKEITAGTTTNFEAALRLQSYFLTEANGFRYNTRATSSGDSPLEDFLARKQGFCQQFSGAFAAMARSLGIPARVNVGFTKGTLTSDGTYLVTLRNAHAWPEIYFEGVGWVRFEPTPGATGVAAPPYAPGTAIAPTTPGGNGAGPGGRGGKTIQLNKSEKGSPNVGRGVDGADGAGGAVSGGVPWLVVSGFALAALIFVTPGALRIIRRRRRLGRRGSGSGSGSRGSDVDHRVQVANAWQELADTGIDLGNPWSTARSPRATAEWLASAEFSPESAIAARRLARQLERVRYAAPASVLTTDPTHDVGLMADARVVLNAMQAAAPARTRWRARLFPRSILSAAANRFADGLDAFDTGSARLRDGARRVVHLGPAE